MAQVLIEEKYLEDIADALRKKTGTNNTYTPAQMAETIRSLGMWSWVKDDGSHYFHLDIQERWQKEQVLNLNLQGTIDWGDGTTTTCSHSTVTQETHTYSNLGKYIIHVTSNTGTSVVWGDGNFASNIRAQLAVRCFELGKNWSFSGQSAFSSLGRVKYIFIHRYEYDSTSITGGTVVALGRNFSYLRSLEYLKCTTGIELGNGRGTVGYTFPVLRAFICPFFRVVGSPSHTTQTVNRNFQYLQYFGSGFSFGETNTTIQNQVWFTDVQNVREINRLPTGITAFMFQNHFQNAVVCEKIIIPSYITSIPSNSFQANIKELHMLGTTPPTLSTTIPVTAGQTRIYVPTGSLSTYTSATNWAQYADYMMEE